MPLSNLALRPAAPASVGQVHGVDRTGYWEHIGQVLERVRTAVEGGWVQDAWYAVRGQSGQHHHRARHDRTPRSGGQLVGACLVGAVSRQTGSVTVEGGPVIDALWDALQEARGLGGPGVAGRAAPPQLREVRARELMRWNDHPSRTAADVLDLIDRATTRVTIEAMTARRPHAERS